MLRAFRQQRQGEAEQAVEAEFLQHARVQHRGRRGRGGIGRRRPGVKREERNENAETDQQEEVRSVLRGGGNDAAGRELLQLDADRKCAPLPARCDRDDQAEQQNEAAERRDRS